MALCAVSGSATAGARSCNMKRTSKRLVLQVLQVLQVLTMCTHARSRCGTDCTNTAAAQMGCLLMEVSSAGFA